MRPRTRKLLARAYRLVALPVSSERPVEITPGVAVPSYIAEHAEAGPLEAERFFDRLPAWLDLSGRSVLDVGCGAGDLCFAAARRGARRVLGIEISQDGARFARARVPHAEPPLPLEFRSYSGSLAELGDERFDAILSKDCFEHYGAIPGSPSAEQMVRDMADRLEPGGLLVVGFGPLWKAPLGGHLEVRMPWAHLVFPESVIFDEFRRVRPPGKTARTFEEGTHVNRMTLERFRTVMEQSGLDSLHFETNVSANPVVRAFRILRRVPGLEEYFTTNVYGIWRRPPA